MRYSKKYIHLLCAPFLLGSEIQADPVIGQPLLPPTNQGVITELYGDMEGPLVQYKHGQIVVHPIFTPEFTQQLHYLIKRSYNITKREEGRFNYYYREELENNRINSFTFKDNTTNTVHILKPFRGIQGNDEVHGLVPWLLGQHTVEGDYPGFVCLQEPTDSTPPIITVVFRGTQSEKFQPMNGVLGPSWLTNFAAAKMEFPLCGEHSRTLQERHLKFHQGYLEKYLNSRNEILEDIGSLWNKIPEDKQAETRFIITGHSQGAGIAIPAGLDITWELGERYFGPQFNNVETPRFFIYALSGPDPTGVRSTAEFIKQVVGHDNILRHGSIFDIVTYACPGENFDAIFYKALFYTLFGVETGYLPVGHLAFDDPQELWTKYFLLNGNTEQLQSIPTINQFLKSAYRHAAFRHAHQNFYSGLHKIPEFYNIHKAISQTGGLSAFVCLNHYGSVTANAECAPTKGRRRISHDESIGASFDPRLPDIYLSKCLWRGECYHNFIENSGIIDDPEVILSEEPIEEAEGFLNDSLRIAQYESDAEDEA